MFAGSNQDNCSNNRSIWEAVPSTERCPQQDWTVPVVAGLYMMFTNLLLVNIVIVQFSNTFARIHTNSEKIWYFHLYTVMDDYSRRIPPPFNLVIYPFKCIIKGTFDNTKVEPSVDEVKEKEQKEYQQTLQKTVAKRNHWKSIYIASTFCEVRTNHD